MKTHTLNLLTVLLATAALTVSGDAVKFIDGWKTWKNARIAAEKNEGTMQVNVVANAKGNYGQIYRTEQAMPEGKYFQITVDNMENSQAFSWLSSPTVKRSFGVLFTGVNTFSPLVNKKFTMSICQNGNRKKNGAWVRYDSYNISAAPENSLVAIKEPAAGALKVGDILKFKVFRSTRCTDPVKIRVFLAERKKRSMQAFKLSKTDFVEAVYDEAAKCYVASMKVTEDAYSFDSAKAGKYMMAATELDGTHSYYTMPFAVKLETANKLPTALFSADSPETRENRQAWYDLVLNKKNLALKKPVKLIPKPNYRITRDKPGVASKDATDLTDGCITTMNTDKIWFDQRAVGIFADGKGTTNTVYLRLDLADIQPVDYIAVRALGGAASGFRYPNKFEVFVSKDNKTFFRTAELVKLAPAEANQSDFVTTFYYPEERPWSQSVCKTFKLNVKADARYIIVRVALDTHFFSDEMAVIAADNKGTDFNNAYSSKGLVFPQDDLTIQPRVAELAIIKGVAAPQTLLVSDFRSAPQPLKKVTAVLDLPEPLTIFRANIEKVTIDGKKYNRCRVPFRKDMRVNPIYILSPENTPDTLPNASLYVEYDGKIGFKQTFPVKIVTLPAFQTFKKIPVCLAWMTTETLFKSYPDLLKNYKHFGFNGAGVFPRYWIKRGQPYPPKEIANTEAIRKAGLTVFMNESPMHIMGNKQKTGSEVFCQTGKPNRVICPSYTGKFYAEEMERVAKNVVMSKPAHVLLDIECFGKAISISAAECTRCKEGIKKSGKNEIDYIYSCGTRMMADFVKALEKGAKEANIPTPKLHMYGLERVRATHGICRFTDVYPALIKSAQPSLYVGGHPEVVHQKIRKNRKLMNSTDIMPWLSTGCYGEYDSCMVEPIVLEALMNGSCGILNYSFGYFDTPLDFYYHALAIKKLAPYEEILLNGKFIDIEGSNKKMFYSMVQKDDEMLLLVGNYFKEAPATMVTLPYSKAEVLDLNTQKSFTASSKFKFNVEPGKFSLFYIKKK